MRVYTPNEVAGHATNKYLGVLVAAKFARMLNEFPREPMANEPKLTTRALEKLSVGDVDYHVIPRQREDEGGEE